MRLDIIGDVTAAVRGRVEAVVADRQPSASLFTRRQLFDQPDALIRRAQQQVTESEVIAPPSWEDTLDQPNSFLQTKFTHSDAPMRHLRMRYLG